MRTQVKTVALIGAGVIGCGWAARFLANGLQVRVWDPSADAERTMHARLQAAWEVLDGCGVSLQQALANLSFCSTVEACVTDVDLVQESAPENLTLKIELHAQISAAAPADALIASSTSGLLPSDFYVNAQYPERCLVVHPFNPVYLLPLVEIVGGKATSAETLDAASELYRGLGMKPLRVRQEVPGFIADRLMESMWREALHMINDGVATPSEIDDAVRFGCGLRWAFMGSFLTFSLAGGNQGMRHFMQQFGPALKLPWTYLEAPDLTDTLLDRIVEGSESLLGGHSIAAMERYRDDCLQALQSTIATVKARHGIND